MIIELINVRVSRQYHQQWLTGDSKQNLVDSNLINFSDAKILVESHSGYSFCFVEEIIGDKDINF